MKKCRYFRSESYRINGGSEPDPTVRVIKEWCTHLASPKPEKNLIGELVCHGEEANCPIPIVVVTRGSKITTPWFSGETEDLSD